VDDSHAAPSNEVMRKTILIVAGMLAASLALITDWPRHFEPAE
jgi:hypothetical protein